MEHGDYDAILAVIRPIMKTLPVLGNVLEGSVEAVRAISIQVMAARKNREDLVDLYKHAATVQSQVIISLRYRGGEDQDALLKSVHQFLAVLIEVKIFVIKATGVKERGVMKKSGHAIVQYFTATSMAGKIAGMKQRISDAAVIFGIAADIRTEERVIAVDKACREIGASLARQAKEHCDSEERLKQELVRAKQDREKHAREQRETALSAEAAQREAAERQLDAEQHDYLDKVLKPAHTAAHYAGNAAEPCTDGTRMQILSALQEWAASDHGPRIYWLAGLAGTGKTTIASSFCRECQAAGVNILSFFISRHTPDRNTITAVVSTLSHQLAQVDPTAFRTIYAALKKHPPILYGKIAVQAKELLVDPLSAMLETAAAIGKRIVIVMDAMDECNDFAASDGRDLLGTLVLALCHRGHDVKLFLTSRYEPELRFMLDRVFDGAQDERETFLLHEVEECYVSADIRTFVAKGFTDVRERFPGIPSTWPPLYQINELVELSGKLFVFASTVLLWIGEKGASPVSRLTEVLAATRDSRPVGPHERSPFSYLDALYLTVLRNATSDIDPDSVINSRLRQILFMVICGDYYLCFDIISGVLRLEHHELHPVLGSLAAVVQIPSTESIVPIVGGYGAVDTSGHMMIQAFHKSFPDFLIDPKRCSDKRFLILRDREEPHLALATLQATAQNLPHVKNESAFATHIQYYWCHHLLNTLRNPNLDSARVLSVIRTWLQARPNLSGLQGQGLTTEDLTSIRFLLAVLVNKLPEPIFTEFRQSVIALVGMRLEDNKRFEMDEMTMHAITAIILYAYFAQEPEASATLSQQRDFLYQQDRPFHRSLKKVSGKIFDTAWHIATQTLWTIAQMCSSEVPRHLQYEILLIKLLEICMVSRLHYTVEPVIHWLEDDNE